jgi:hypothetical protein
LNITVSGRGSTVESGTDGGDELADRHAAVAVAVHGGAAVAGARPERDRNAADDTPARDGDRARPLRTNAIEPGTTNRRATRGGHLRPHHTERRRGLCLDL